MPAVQENHQDAVALSDLAYRSLDALDNDFVILSQLILKQTNASAQLGKELEHIKLGIHERVKGKYHHSSYQKQLYNPPSDKFKTSFRTSSLNSTFPTQIHYTTIL